MKVLRRRTAAENGSLHSLKGSPEHCAAKKTVFDFVRNIHRDGGYRSIRLNTMDVVSLSQKYFATWNAHDAEGIKSLHAATCDPELIKLFSRSSNESLFNFSS